jgi:hypothetical protein
MSWRFLSVLVAQCDYCVGVVVVHGVELASLKVELTGDGVMGADNKDLPKHFGTTGTWTRVKRQRGVSVEK